MLSDGKFRTIETPSEGVFSDRGSKFLAYAFPVKSEEDVRKIIVDVKSRHPKARHHCWAFKLGQEKPFSKTNDDGEPAGSAGQPILNIILSNQLTDVLILVVRYFGGTLLGKPGLINAYKTASSEAVSAAKIIEISLVDIYLLEFSYPQINEVMKIVKEYNLHICRQSFDSHCEMEIGIPVSLTSTMIQKFVRLSGLTRRFIRVSYPPC